MASLIDGGEEQVLQQLWWSPVPRLPWELFNLCTVHISSCTSRAQFAQIVRIVRAQTHFYYAFRYGDQDGSVHCGDPWHCGARSSLPMLIHIPDHFIAPSVSPVSWCPQHSLRPLCVLSDPVGHARTSPLFSPENPFSMYNAEPHTACRKPRFCPL